MPITMNIENKMFVTDLDGTLFTDDKFIHPSDLAALEHLGKRGVIRVFATGRSIYSFQKAVTGMGFSPIGEDMPVDYVIFSTGAAIMECTHGEIIKKENLGPGDVCRIAQVFDDFDLDYMIHRPVPDTRYFIYKIADPAAMAGKEANESVRDGRNPMENVTVKDRSYGNVSLIDNVPAGPHGGRNARSGGKFCEKLPTNPDFYTRIAMYQEFCRPMTKTDLATFGESTEILAIVPSYLGHETADRVQQTLGDFSVIKATSPLDGKSLWIEVFNPRVSKSQAVAWLCECLDVHRNHVVAVGNDYNDLDLLQWAGRGFVVANTPSDLQKEFEIVASNNQCGVAEAVSLVESESSISTHYGLG